MKSKSGFMSLTLLVIAGLIALVVIVTLLAIFSDGLDRIVYVVIGRIPG